jgi:DNA polymerase-4
MAVGGGVILAASYEARRRGVRGPMNIRAARALCPDLIVVPPRMDAYTQASRRVFEIFDDTTPLVEPISIDEAFLDVSGLGRLVGPPKLVAARLRARVKAEVGLAISVGVARTKFLAKVASGVCKPDGLLVVEPDGELEFLHPLPVGRLWGVGPKTEEKLGRSGITTVGQVAELDEVRLVAMLGAGSGRQMHALAHNRDPRRVMTGKRRSSIGSQRALGQRRPGFAELEAILLELVDHVSRRLRDGNRVGRTVMLRFRFGDFTATPARTACPRPPDRPQPFSMPATRCSLHAGTRSSAGGSRCSGSPSPTCRPPTPFNRAWCSTSARRSTWTVRSTPFAIDTAQDSIGRATLLGRASGIHVPLLPDPGAARP